MPLFLIKNARIVNEGKVYNASVLIKDQFIEKIYQPSEELPIVDDVKIIDAKGRTLIPGVIDDQVHFREPGFVHKGNINTESKAAIAGGVTSFMDMPNTSPQTTTQELLEEKFALASQNSFANYSFFMGATNDNIKELVKTNPKNTCGIKIFMGASTGNMLVDNLESLERIFKESPVLIATHCEDEQIIQTNLAKYKKKFGDDIPASYHPIIRSVDACYKSSSLAVELAKKHNTRLHILHISTAKELSLFTNTIPLSEKRITAEVCIPHLCFDDHVYAEKGNYAKSNPAIKTKKDREALIKALNDDRIDIIATDHAPHTNVEKMNCYLTAPSGMPSIQFSLLLMLEMVRENKISLTKVVEKMCHAPAECFKIHKRGYIREGYYADLTLVDLDAPWELRQSDIVSKCSWSPFEGQTFHSKVMHTFVNGYLAYDSGIFHEQRKGERLVFDR